MTDLRTPARPTLATARQAKADGERAARSPWARGLARWGLVSRGVLYALVGLLALRVALLGRGSTPDRESALKTVADEPFGRYVLGAIAVGLAGYALWQLARAVLGGNLEGGEDESAWKRIGYAARGVFYGAIFVSTTLIVLGADEGGDKNKEDQATAYVLDLPGGPFLVAGIGLGFLGGGRLQPLPRRDAQVSREAEAARDERDRGQGVHRDRGRRLRRPSRGLRPDRRLPRPRRVPVRPAGGGRTRRRALRARARVLRSAPARA